MGTIITKVYKFDELSEQAKQTAIEEVRNKYYQDNDFANWAVDDCALFEPKHEELSKLFGKDYDFPLIKNNRRVYFDTDQNRYIDISCAMEIQKSTQFLKWLGLNNRLIDKVDYTICEDTIEFNNQSHLEFTEQELIKITEAVDKFEEHCQEILNRIEAGIDYRFTDEAIIEDIEANDYEFLSNGKGY